MRKIKRRTKKNPNLSLNEDIIQDTDDDRIDRERTCARKRKPAKTALKRD